MAHDHLTGIATADLVSELLARYHEGLFIGYGPTSADVISKLDEETAMAGVLIDVLTNLLERLKVKMCVPAGEDGD